MSPVPPVGDTTRDGSGSRGRWLSATVLFGSLSLFAALAAACWLFYDDAEQSFLEDRTSEASALLGVSVSQVRGPLEAAATIARVTDGDPASFAEAFEGRVGEDAEYASVALFDVDTADQVVLIGDPLALDDDTSDSARSVIAAVASEPFVVVDLLDSAAGRRLGYAVGDGADEPRFVVYAERTLSPDPNVRGRSDGPFGQLDYAIYLGEEAPDALLTASTDGLPIDGRRASASSEFGNEQLVLVMSPIGRLSNALLAHLWWLVAVIGAALSLLAAWFTDRLYARREQALTLARDNARLYDEQRHIAETLQLGLLPQELVPPPGGQLAARYWPAGEASLIGGDFYDAFRVDEHRWAVLIGDVCGKGTDAAVITGIVRHTVRAAARTATSPSDVLLEVHRSLLDHQPTTFCTACFFYVAVHDDGRQLVRIALGGHPRPLLQRGDGGVVEIGTTGTLLGMFEPTLTDATVEVAPGDTIVLYTDGLTDAPQQQAVPVQELIDLLATAGSRSVEQVADDIRPLKRRRRPHGSTDDTALVVLRFGSATSDDGSAHDFDERSSAVV